jgi:hypothetical protein
MFKTFSEPGFQMTFANEWTINVQWNKFSYSSGKNPSKTAEIAAWNKNGENYLFTDNGRPEILNNLTPNEIANWIQIIANIEE